MTYTPVFLPKNTTLDRSLTESQPTTPRLLGALQSFIQTAQQLPIPEITQHLAGLYTEKFNPGQFLSQDQIKEKYPLVASQFPDGGHDHTVRNISDRKNKEIFNQNILNGMPRGLLSGASRFSGFAIANLMSPTAVGLGAGATAASAKLAPMLFSKIPETQTAARLAANALIGVTEGGAVTTPIALSTSDYYKQIGMPVSPWDTTKMIGIGAALGGVLKTALGAKYAIMPEDELRAFEAAKSQIAAGKQVDVDAIVKNSANLARELDPHTDTVRLADVRENLVREIEDNAKRVEEAKADWEEVTRGKEIAEEGIDTRKGTAVVDRALEIGRLPEEALDDGQKSFLNTLPDTDEIKSALTLKQIPEDSLSAAQKRFLDRFDNEEEVKLTQERLEKETKQLEKNQEKLKKEPDNQDLRDEIEFLRNKIDKSNERVTELNRLDREPVKIQKARSLLKDLTDKETALKQMLEDTDAHISLVENRPAPLSNNDLADRASHMQSPLSNDTYSPSVQSRLKEDLERPEFSADELIKNSEDNLKELDNKGLLDNESQRDLREIEEMKTEESSISQAIKNMMNCLIGR